MMKPKVNDVLKWTAIVVYFSLAAVLLGSLILLLRVTYADEISYMVASFVAMMFVVATLIQKKLITLIVIVSVFLLMPAYYTSMYRNSEYLNDSNYINPASNNNYKFYNRGEVSDFLLLENNTNGIKCFGAFKINEHECGRIGKYLFGNGEKSKPEKNTTTRNLQ